MDLYLARCIVGGESSVDYDSFVWESLVVSNLFLCQDLSQLCFRNLLQVFILIIHRFSFHTAGFSHKYQTFTRYLQ